MTELYSRPLSPEAKLKLIDFIQSYIETLMITEVDDKAEIAKAKAMEVLKTDIDILVFVTTLMSLHQAMPLIDKVIRGKLSSREAAELIVEIAEKARQIDKSRRPGGS